MQQAVSYFTVALLISLLVWPAAGITMAKGLMLSRDGSSEVAGESSNQIRDRSEIRELVERTFGENHPMLAVARCESDFRQYDNSGEVLRNPRSGAMGVFQLLESYHREPAERLGIDIFTAEGNIAYAKKLYESLGLAPWSPSSLCWDEGGIDATNPTGITVEENQSTRVPVKVRRDGKIQPLLSSRDATDNNEEKIEPAEDPVITKKLVSGVRDPEVKELQQLLNDIGYQLSDSGPGSPGKETNFFGAKTRAAVKDFQCDQEIVCSGGRYSTGYGLVDLKTRNTLNKMADRQPDGDRFIGNMRVRTDESNTADNQDNDDLARQLAQVRQQIARLQSRLNQ